jgi:hypothetical protein
MKKLLTLEEIAQFMLGIYLFNQTPYAWWWFPVLLFLPDISMLGYLINPKIGAWLYNFVHHKLLTITILICGYVVDNSTMVLIGAILLAHSAMDRALGYGLKHEDSFSHTHLGIIGKK